MQISNSIQAQTEGTAVNEGPPQVSAWDIRNGKKAKQSIFAKLLDNLTGKTEKFQKTDGLIAENVKNKKSNNKLTGKEGHIFAENAGLFAKDASFLQSKPDLSAQKAQENTVKAALTAGKTGINQQTKYLLPNADDRQINSLLQKSGENTAGNPVKHPDSVDADFIGARRLNQAKKPDLSALDPKINTFLQKEKNVNLADGDDISENSKSINSKSADTGKNLKTNKAAVDFFKARNTERQTPQINTDPKPGLVDILGARETRENSVNQETRGKKGREKAVFDIRDLRSPDNRQQNITETLNSANIAGSGSEKIDADIRVDLLPETAAAKSNPGGEKTGTGRSFEDMLSQKLDDGLNSDIVRQAQVILRDGGEGTIKLSLKPESLGNVKIRLEMTENKITGHIIVESGEALRAFERELPVLEKAFADLASARPALT
ncbi:MAG: flagellar hook-length control protein FliK [Treponema sp.]|nr:flagellar hook-length control protein FliK [Treponema sp.]